MSSHQALEQLRRREALAVQRIHRTGDELVGRVLGEPRKKQERTLATALVPMGLAAGLGFLLAPRRASRKGAVLKGRGRMASAGWMMVAYRAAGALGRVGLARMTNPPKGPVR